MQIHTTDLVWGGVSWERNGEITLSKVCLNNSFSRQYASY